MRYMDNASNRVTTRQIGNESVNKADLARPTPLCVEVNDDRRITTGLTELGMSVFGERVERTRTYEGVELGSGIDVSNSHIVCGLWIVDCGG